MIRTSQSLAHPKYPERLHTAAANNLTLPLNPVETRESSILIGSASIMAGILLQEIKATTKSTVLRLLSPKPSTLDLKP